MGSGKTMVLNQILIFGGGLLAGYTLGYLGLGFVLHRMYGLDLTELMLNQRELLNPKTIMGKSIKENGKDKKGNS